MSAHEIAILKTVYKVSDQEALSSKLLKIFSESRCSIVSSMKIHLGSKEDAQDVVQEAVLRLLLRNKSLDDRDLRALFYVTARNIAYDKIRKRKRSVSIDNLYLEEEFSDDRLSPERIISAKEQLDLIRIWLKELPEKCQFAFSCYKLDGLEYSEVACRMGLTESMVRKYVLRAVAHFSKRLSEAR